MDAYSTVREFLALESRDYEVLNWLLWRDLPESSTSQLSQQSPAVSSQVDENSELALSCLNGAALDEALVMGANLDPGSRMDGICVPFGNRGRFVLATQIIDDNFEFLFRAAGYDPNRPVPRVVSSIIRYAVDLDHPTVHWSTARTDDSSLVILKNRVNEFGSIAIHHILCKAPPPKDVPVLPYFPSAPPSLPNLVVSDFVGLRYCKFCPERGIPCECGPQPRLTSWGLASSQSRSFADWKALAAYLNSAETCTGWSEFRFWSRRHGEMQRFPGQVTQYFGKNNARSGALRQRFLSAVHKEWKISRREEQLGRVELRKLLDNFSALTPPTSPEPTPADPGELRIAVVRVAPKAPVHRCQVCKRGFASKSNLNRHLRRGRCMVGLVDDIALLRRRALPTCGECGIEFSQRSNLTRHMYAVHQKRRDFRCEFCNHQFASKDNCERHKKLVHTGHGLDTMSTSDLTAS